MCIGQMDMLWLGVAQVAVNVWFLYRVAYLYFNLVFMPLFTAMADSFLMIGCICWITTLFPFHNFVGCLVTDSNLKACLSEHPFFRSGLDYSQTTDDILHLHAWLSKHIVALASFGQEEL